MPSIKLQGFSGIVPRIGPTGLQDQNAVVAQNVKLQSGELRPWRKPVVEFTPLNDAVQTIYRLSNASTSAWLEWESDVDVVAGPVADTTDYRIYYTGDGTPKKTNWSLATTGSGAKPVDHYDLGVPAPTVAPTLGASGGSAPTEVRAYVETFVSTFGSVLEESAPSPAGTVTCNSSGATVNLSVLNTAPAGDYNITHRRIYRTVTGATTVTYNLVVELPIATVAYADTKTVAELGIELPSTYYEEPLDDLTGLVAMPNGMLAGFVGNQVWFCEPYLPHAWPSIYMRTTDFPIVALGVFGNTLVVATEKNPYLMTGSHPSSMSEEKLPLVQPCVSKRSLAYDQYGVLYASPDGIVGISPGSQDLITAALFTRDEWQTFLPTTMLGAIYNNHYVGFHSTATGASAIVLARNDTPPLTKLEFPAAAVFVEETTGDLYAVSSVDNAVYKLDANPVNNMSYEWRSKKFVLPRPASFAAFQVDADFDYINDTDAINDQQQAVIDANQAVFAAGASTSIDGDLNSTMVNEYAVNGSMLQPIPSAAESRTIQVIIVADGSIVYSTTVSSLEPQRLPSGFKAYVWEFIFSGNAPMRSFAVGTTLSDLKTL
jgi:hypothetical protein